MPEITDLCGKSCMILNYEIIIKLYCHFPMVYVYITLFSHSFLPFFIRICMSYYCMLFYAFKNLAKSHKVIRNCQKIPSCATSYMVTLHVNPDHMKDPFNQNSVKILEKGIREFACFRMNN